MNREDPHQKGIQKESIRMYTKKKQLFAESLAVMVRNQPTNLHITQGLFRREEILDRLRCISCLSALPFAEPEIYVEETKTEMELSNATHFVERALLRQSTIKIYTNTIKRIDEIILMAREDV